MVRNILLAGSILASSLLPSYAQTSLEKLDLCPNWDEIDPLIPCETVESYGDLGVLIENAPSGAEFTLCPFFLRKVTSVAPITVRKGIRITCARLTPDSFCTIVGTGNHLVIDTAEDTLFQGFSFRQSNDHAINIWGDADNAESAAHTFCQTSFIENVRSEESRGGALMLQKSSGTVNVVESFFQDNFSSTFGAAIYSRANQLNIILSFFIANRSNGYGPAVYTAVDGNVMIKTSTFINNRGRSDLDVVFNPGNGTSIYQDGLGNTMNNGDCLGVYNLAEESCAIFGTSRPTSTPTNAPTNSPTFTPKVPTNQPTERAILQKLTLPPSPSPTFNPTAEPTDKPTSDPTAAPTDRPTSRRPLRARRTAKPTQVFSKKPTNSPTNAPSSKPRREPFFAPVQTIPVTEEPTIQPTPQETTRAPTIGDVIANKCKFRAIEEGSNCVDVNSFEEFKVAIESTSEDIIFCGGFNLLKTTEDAVDVSTSVDIRCIDQCSFYGYGPFLNIGGVASKIRLENLKFVSSREASAVFVSTNTKTSQTTFCDSHFLRNEVSENNILQGGAITVERGSGVVNIVNNTFTANTAPNGGAIHSEGFKLNVVGSKFVANNAYDAGNAIFVGNGNYLSVHKSQFILNTEKVSRLNTRDRPNSNSFAIVVEPQTTLARSAPLSGTVVDGGDNLVSMSGNCRGAAVGPQMKCQEFS